MRALSSPTSSPALARVGLRGLQSVSALVALGSLCNAFRRDARFSRTVMLGSPTVSFALLTTYSAALVGVYALSAAKQPPAVRRALLLGDLALALALLAVGLLLATSDDVADCAPHDGAVHCAPLRTATTSAFVAHAAFVGSAALAAVQDPHGVRVDIDDDDEAGDEDGDATARRAKLHRA